MATFSSGVAAPRPTAKKPEPRVLVAKLGGACKATILGVLEQEQQGGNPVFRGVGFTFKTEFKQGDCVVPIKDGESYDCLVSGRPEPTSDVEIIGVHVDPPPKPKAKARRTV